MSCLFTYDRPSIHSLDEGVRMLVVVSLAAPIAPGSLRKHPGAARQTLWRVTMRLFWHFFGA